MSVTDKKEGRERKR